VLTHRQPFLDPRLFAQRNFFIAMVLISIYGLLTLPPMVMMPAFLEHVRGFPIDVVGVLQSPRGAGIMLAMFLSGRLSGKVDPRILIVIGMLCIGIATASMSRWNINVGQWPVVWTGFVQGIGAGIILVPVQMIAFSLLAPEMRNEGAAIINLVRTMFSSIGVSVTLALFTVASAMGRSGMIEHVTPYNSVLPYSAYAGMYTAGSQQGLAIIERQIDLQAAMMGYNASFLFLAIGAFISIPLVLLIGRTKPASEARERGENAKPEPIMIVE